MQRVIERILNLLAFLLTAGRPVTADEIRHTVAGYEQEGDEAFRRTFERDKDLLRGLGIPLRLAFTDRWEVEQGYVVPIEDYALEDPGLTDEERTALWLAAQVVRIGGLASEPAAVQITLRDQIKPVVTWVSPISSDNTFDTIGGTLRLEVEATDNIGVGRVRFYWWDAIAKVYVELGTITTPPYRVDVNVGKLHMFWNQIDAIARDSAGNLSDSTPLLIYVTPTVYFPVITR